MSGAPFGKWAQVGRPIVLVHGAFRGGWAWERVLPLLRDDGLEVYAPSLPGCGERFDGTGVDSLSVWVDDLAALLVDHDLSDVLLVGHSQGAIVVAGVAAALPDRVSAVLHLDGAVADPGERAVDLGGGDLEALPGRSMLIPHVPARPEVLGDADMAGWMNERMTPTPMGPSLDEVPVIPASVEQHFIFAQGTPAEFPSEVSRRRRGERGLPYLTVPGGHDLPLQEPVLTAALILAVALGNDPAALPSVEARGSASRACDD